MYRDEAKNLNEFVYEITSDKFEVTVNTYLFQHYLKFTFPSDIELRDYEGKDLLISIDNTVSNPSSYSVSRLSLDFPGTRTTMFQSVKGVAYGVLDYVEPSGGSSVTITSGALESLSYGTNYKFTTLQSAINGITLPDESTLRGFIAIHLFKLP